MRTGRYNIGELFASRHLEQFVIPEIQRDYVWGSSNVDALLTNILANFAAWKEETSRPRVRLEPTGSSNDTFPVYELDGLKKGFVSFYAQRTWMTNIGFIYAYCDADLPGQYALIDGQQRLTSVYLLLLALASLEGAILKERFRARYCFLDQEGRAGQAAPTRLDYRLREETARFLRQFADFALSTPSAEKPISEQIKDQSWCLNRDLADPTVKNLTDNYQIIRERLTKEPTASIRGLYDYVEDLVECWYFDTNESEQGEELYLYLNARGESIANNENLKAELLKQLSGQDKEEWGRKWEEWQDYFWQHRGLGLSDSAENPNADRGFNSFIECIRHLEALNDGSGAPDLPSLEAIEKYLHIMKWLEQQRTPFAKRFAYSGWVEKWFTEVWGILNQEKAARWGADLGNENESTAHNQMVMVWGSLLCGAKSIRPSSPNEEYADCERIFRLIRLFYLRYHNFNRTVKRLPEIVDRLFQDKAEVLDDSEEERLKWLFLRNRPDEERRGLEAVIWEIEDHPLNLKGRDLGGVNLTHLVDLTLRPDLSQLEKTRDRFYELFPAETDDPSDDAAKKVAVVLLSYGAFWNRVGPWYHENLDLGDWRRTIRGKGNQETAGSDKTVFRRFFEELMHSGLSFDQFFEQKRQSEKVEPGSEKDLRRALIWYSQRLNTRLFDKGMHVAVKIGEDEQDRHFPNLKALWNTKGDFRGTGGNIKVAELVGVLESPNQAAGGLEHNSVA